MSNYPSPKKLATACSLATALFFGTGANAEVEKFTFNLTAKPLSEALVEFSEKTDVVIMYGDGVKANAQTLAISGEYSPEEALGKMLEGSGLQYKKMDENVFVIVKSGNGGEKKVITDTKVNNQNSNLVIEEIIVTAQRREQKLQDVPMAVSVATPEEFVSRGLSSLNDVIAYTPGIDVHSTFDEGARGVGRITARGVGQMGRTAVVGVYVDDIPTTSTGPAGAGSFFFLDATLLDIDRVELLKGPQGTLYGATSIGGSIKYVTRKPSLEGVTARVETNISNTKNGGVGKIHSAMFSAPIVSDKLGFSVTGFRSDSEGFVDQVDPATGAVVKEDATGSDGHGYSADLYLQATERLSFRVRHLYQQSDYQGGGIVDISEDLDILYPPLGRAAAAGDATLDNTLLSGTIEYDMDWATLTSSSSRTELNHVATHNTLIGFGFGALVDSIEGNPAGTTTDIPYNFNDYVKRFVQEVKLTSQDSERFEWITGLFYLNEETAHEEDAVARPTGFDLLTFAGPYEFDEYAAFANLTYYVNPDFDVSVGGRISRVESTAAQEASGFFAAPPADAPDITDTKDTWLFAARYRPSRDLSLYSRIASGFRTAASGFPLQSGGFTSPGIIEPDSLWSYELGAKGQRWNGLLSYDLALWYIDWSNFQATISFGSLATEGNAEHGITAKGIEGSFTLRPFDGFHWTTAFAYTNSRLNEDEPLLPALKGQKMPFVPEWTVTGNGGYEFNLVPGVDAHLGLGVRYVGRTPSAFTSPLNPTVVNLVSKPYWVGDLHAGIVWDRIRANLYVTNVTDTEGLHSLSGFRNLATGAVQATGSVVRPRTVGISLTFEY